MADRNEIIPNDEVLKFYFYFIQERMNMFWNRCEGKWPLSKDPILGKYKFTNVYRVCDRVSQYLLKNVIYKDIANYCTKDILLRILVFKIFNKPETWEYIINEYGEITISNFDVKQISKLLTKRQKIAPIFNNAYMMTGSHSKYNHLKSKHEKWLTMVKEEIIDGHILDDIVDAQSLKTIYNKLRGCSFIGDFLAYQYAIDFNYSPYINFSEDSFVKAGIGAIRGIKKCFKYYGSCYEDAIVYVKDNFCELQNRYGFNEFKPLPGHTPTLLDLQNCFCETDKYLREKMPQLQVDNVRIKQKYKESNKALSFVFPDKWNIKIDHELCIQPNTRELTLF